MSSRSILWNYFEKGAEAAVCLTCKKSISNRGNTTNLRNHLKFRHPNVYSQFEKQRTREPVSQDTSAEIEIEDEPIQPMPSTSQFPRNQKQVPLSNYTLNKQAQDKIDKALAYFISVEMMPYNLVEKDGFKRFVGLLNASYKIPGRKTISENLIPSIYNNTKTIIADKLKNVVHCSFTTDCWTSQNYQPFIALTCHYVDDVFQLHSVCLGCEELLEDHNSDNLSECIDMMLYDWDITDTNKITCFTTDYGSNIVKAVRQGMQKIHLCCFGHAINIAVTKCLGVRQLKGIIEKVKLIQGLFAHSWKAKRELHTIQESLNLKKTSIPSYCKTRWWSLLNLVKVVIEQELPLIKFLQTYKTGYYKKNILRTEEINVLKEVVELLTPIQNITEILAGEKFVTASLIIPVCHEINEGYEAMLQQDSDLDTMHEEETLENTQQIIQTIQEILKNRYMESTDTFNTLKLCTLFDPRFKGNHFNAEDMTHLKEMILEMGSQLPTAITEQVEVVKKKTCGLSSFLKHTRVHCAGTPEGPHAVQNKLEVELLSYVNTPPLDADEGNPLIWWAANAGSYQCLSILAKKYLCIQATSVPSERVFSKGRHIITDLRSSLTADHASQLIFLAMNRKYVQF